MRTSTPQTFESGLYQATVDVTNKRIYFWGGIFSNWAKCDIFYKDYDQPLNCAEQAMMLEKALMFGDKESHDKILKEKNPRNQKMLGRQVKGFDKKVWEEKALEIVTDIVYQKFYQNPVWRELLIMSDGYEIVEASPYDEIWGVKIGLEDEDLYDKSKWKGTNWLGIALMNARKRIIEKV